MLKSFKLDNNKLDFQLIFISLFVFFLPLNQKISTVLILTNVLVSFFYYKKFSFKLFKNFLFLFLLYIVYVISYFRDTNILDFKIFEQKAALLALPLMFVNYKVKQDTIKLIFKIFVLGCLASYIYLLCCAIYNSINFSTLEFNPIIPRYRDLGVDSFTFQPLQTNYFLGRIFAFTMQSTVLSIFFSLSIFLLNKYQFFSRKNRKLAMFFLSLGVIQIFGIVGLFIWIIILFVQIKFFLKIVTLSLIFFTITLVSITVLKDKPVYNEIKKYDNRLSIWPTSIYTISQNVLFGHGYKSAQKKLEKNYPKKGNFGAISQQYKLDSHNLYLQILLESGVLGLIILLLVLYPYFQFSNIDNFVICFFTAFIIVSITESIFNIYIGLSSSLFFYCLFLNYNFYKKNETL